MLAPNINAITMNMLTLFTYIDRGRYFWAIKHVHEENTKYPWWCILFSEPLDSNNIYKNSVHLV